MPVLHCPAEDALIAVVDIQPAFMEAIHEKERVVQRSDFLIQVGKTLGIPIIATEQNPSRMGTMDEKIVPYLTWQPLSKMTFSCWEAPGFQEAVESAGRPCVVLVGIETHICVALTALDLLNNGYHVFICPDAVSSRTLEMHKLGMKRMRDAGAVPSHTETLAYEWMGSAEHEKFREVLQLVKASQ